MPTQIQLRRGTSSEWSTSNPTLAYGEIGLETDTKQFKLGNGSTSWNSLPYGGIRGLPSNSISDIDPFFSCWSP